MLMLELDERKILGRRIEALKETYHNVCGREVSDRFLEYLETIPMFIA
ncbi:hypothetical protein [Thermosediminibacter oceani]|uniref:Uncharacterized protein n=1 Tax=Thermosediminibacter oceani (strain ATCC BAA-1034 / DSM 16646 / JW/IW-1228P) TaxID=555079 RepID=D9S2X0_THEOJ|nr:hypothetical protein [Thermosediminibacter oceani]ADL07747.1 hypothetical protein Toce_0985 [Thermosediminibacter oceani DSM 16646]